MATQDISQLVVEVKSTGIQTAANQLDKLATSADKAEAAVKKLGTLVVSTSASTATAQAQAATSGVNNAQTTATQILSIAQKRDIELYNLRVSGDARLRAITERRDMEEYTTAQSQAEKIAAIQQKRDMELYTDAVASAERIKGIQEKRDIELYTASVANAERIKGIQEKRDVELYTEAVAQAEKIKAIQQKRDMEEYTEAVAQAERIASIQQKRDMELYTERVDAAAKQKAIQEKRDMESYTSAQAEAERIIAIEQKRDIELYETRVAANAKLAAEEEKQRKLNAAFQTASISSQIRTATQAQVYGSMGGDATATFGSAAATADVNALTAAQARLAEATRAARNAQVEENAALAEAHALARGLSGSFGALWVTYGNMLGMGVGLALGASMLGVVSVGKQVEQTLEEIRVQSQVSMADMATMGQTVSDLGKGAQGPKEVAEALKVLSFAGLNAKEALAGVNAALNLSLGGDVGVEKAAETLVQVGTSLGYVAADYDHLGDVIQKTAAVSMSSTDSISSAFKSAAAVGEVYGASLNDIALGLASVANLGIQGTSAGTALKNFYKDLSASTSKVTQTMKDMHTSVADFRDADGFMLPLYDVVKKLNAGLGTLDGKARNMAMVKLFSQQGAREGAELLKMINTASTELDEKASKANGTPTMYANKLAELQDQIKQAAAFSTQAAIAMAQTTSNQLKSVGNTLETVFADVFKSIAPQIGDVARALKSAFNSSEFQNGMTTVMTTIANLTVTLVEHGKQLAIVAEAWAGWKILDAVQGLVVAAKAFDTLTIAENISTVATKAFWVSLGPLAVAIAALGAAWLVYKANKDSALDINSGTANLNEYINTTLKATTHEAEYLEMRKKGASEADILRKKQMDSDKDMADQVVANATKELNAKKAYVDELKKSLDPTELKMVADADKQHLGDTGFTDIDKYRNAVKTLGSAQQVYDIQVRNVTNSEQKLAELRQKTSDLADAQAREQLKNRPTGDGELSGKANGKGVSDAYNAAIAVYTDDIKAANQVLAQFDAQENARFKAGQIGRVQVINETADEQIATYKRIAADAAAAKAIADRTPNKTADSQRFKDEEQRALQSAAQAEKMRTDNMVEAHKQAETTMTNLKIKSLDDQGKYVEAANLKWSSDGQLALKQAQEDLAKYGAMYPWLADEVKAYEQIRDDAMNSAQVKQDTEAFNIALTQTQETLKGLKTAQFGNSIDTIFASATKASEDFNKKIEVATKKRNDLWVTALTTGTPQAIKAYEDANKALLAVGDDQKKMWESVGATITTALGNAFGSAGTSLGQLNQAMIAYNQSENATAEDRAKQYGDMAQAASGFFNKQSMGYKALNGIAQVFHIAEMARTLVRTVAYVAEGAANMFGQAGFGGFAGVAAMGAVMAGLGFAASGASSHGADPKLDAEYVQKNQGTGTVLGDATAKSASIADSISSLKNNSDVTLPINQAMLESLQSIDASMKGLGRMLVQGGVADGSNFNVQTGTTASSMFGSNNTLNTVLGANTVGGAAQGAAIGAFFGGPFGAAIGALGGAIVGKLASLWGKTTQTLVDSGLQFGGTVKSLEAGQGINQYAAVKTDKSSWFGLSKSSSTSVQTAGVSDEISQQFGLVFSGLETSLKSAAGALGTNSDAVGKAIDNMVITTTKISLKGLTGTALTDAINNVMSATMDQIALAAYPQMQAFQQVGEGYAQTVIRVASGVEQADVALKQLNITAINYQDIQNKQGDVAFELAKQSILATEGIGGVSDMLQNMTGTISDLTTAYKALTAIRTQLNAMNMNGGGLTSDMVMGAGGLTQLQTALTTFQDKYFTDQEKAGIMLKTVTAQFSQLGLALPATRSALRDLIDQATQDNPLLAGQLLALSGAYDSMATSVETATKTQTDALNTTIDGLNKFADTLKSFRNSLVLGDSSILTPTQKYVEAKQQYEDTVAKAMAGDATAQGNVTGTAQAYLDASRTINASSQAYTDTYNQVMDDINKMGASTDGQLSNAEKQLAALQDQSLSLAALNATATSMKTDLDTIATASVPVTSAAPVAVDTSALEAQIADLTTQLADSQAANAAALDELKAVVYDSQAQGADKVATAVTTTATDTAWVAQTMKALTTER